MNLAVTQPDTLTLADEFCQGGFSQQQANTQAKVMNRLFVETEFATKSDINRIEKEFATKSDIQRIQKEFTTKIDIQHKDIKCLEESTKKEIKCFEESMKKDFKCLATEMRAFKTEITTEMKALKAETSEKITSSENRMTIRLGSITVAGVVFLSALKLF